MGNIIRFYQSKNLESSQNFTCQIWIQEERVAPPWIQGGKHLDVHAFLFSPVTTEASSSDRVEQWRRPRGISAPALAAVVNQRPFQPHFWHTLHLVSSFSSFPPPSASDPSRQTTLDKQQETKALISPLNLVETQCRFDCENKCDAATVGAGWKGGLVAARSCCSLDPVQQTGSWFVLLLWPDQRGWLSALAALIRRHTSLFRGSDKIEQLLHTFVFS